MREPHRYGDKGTIVTLREQVVAVLFVMGIAALLIGPIAIPRDEPPRDITRTASASPQDSSGPPKGLRDDAGASGGTGRRSPSRQEPGPTRRDP